MKSIVEMIELNSCKNWIPAFAGMTTSLETVSFWTTSILAIGYWLTQKIGFVSPQPLFAKGGRGDYRF
jgi:hypothetical protein